MTTLTMTGYYEDINCGKCNTTFFIPDYLYKKLKETGEGWYCPLGHSRVFCNSEISVLKKKVEQEKRRRIETEGQLETEKRYSKRLGNQKRAIKGVLTKTKQRIAKGVCPSCNRTFTNSRMARHIATQHPDFVKHK